jgi:hypothetical protein
VDTGCSSGNYRGLLLPGQRLQASSERFTNWIHQGAGDELVATMKSKETGDALFPLQARNIDIQVPPIDSFHFQSDALGSISATLRDTLISAPVRLRSFGIDWRFGGLNRWRELLAVLHCRPEPSLGLCGDFGRGGNTPSRSEAKPR